MLGAEHLVSLIMGERFMRWAKTSRARNRLASY